MNEKKISLDELFKIAVDFHTKDKIIDAKNIYEKILEVKPDHFLALSNLGIVFSQLGEFNKAVELFNQTVKINPDYAEGFNNLGNALFEISEFDKSLDSYKQAVKLNPNFSDAFNNLGNVYKKKLFKAVHMVMLNDDWLVLWRDSQKKTRSRLQEVKTN